MSSALALLVRFSFQFAWLLHGSIPGRVGVGGGDGGCGRYYDVSNHFRVTQHH